MMDSPGSGRLPQQEPDQDTCERERNDERQEQEELTRASHSPAALVGFDSAARHAVRSLLRATNRGVSSRSWSRLTIASITRRADTPPPTRRSHPSAEQSAAAQ